MMQNAPIKKFWGPLFDYFVDVRIFIILDPEGWGGSSGAGE